LRAPPVSWRAAREGHDCDQRTSVAGASARRLLDLPGEARGVPPAIGRGAQRVDEAAFENAAKQRAVCALTSLRTAAEHPANQVIAGQRANPFIGVPAEATSYHHVTGKAGRAHLHYQEATLLCVTQSIPKAFYFFRLRSLDKFAGHSTDFKNTRCDLLSMPGFFVRQLNKIKRSSHFSVSLLI
jgi:hypothetical protein